MPSILHSFFFMIYYLPSNVSDLCCEFSTIHRSTELTGERPAGSVQAPLSFALNHLTASFTVPLKPVITLILPPALLLSRCLDLRFSYIHKKRDFAKYLGYLPHDAHGDSLDSFL